jgi:hypothetical protein
MKVALIACVLMIWQPLASGQTATHYPNELPGYQFYENAKWRGLTPSSSTIKDVRRLLGDPNNATDLNHATEPYKGDEGMTYVVFTYSGIMPGWDILIYVGRSCSDSQIPRLCSVDLLPQKRIPFGHVLFPSTFTKHHVAGADAGWDEYTDGSGLRYEVYTTKTPYGDELRGDLNRISYGSHRLTSSEP